MIFKIFFILLFSLKAYGLNTNQKSSVDFFVKEFEKKESKWKFNEYENLISGSAAFIIGNIGYVTTDVNAVLNLTYSAIQTIGIINVGQGIYKMNSPSLEGSFKDLLTQKKADYQNSEQLAAHLIKIFANEKRAKRLSLFYSSALLSLQYTLNATLYGTTGKLKNIYIFLGGVNAIVSLYSAFYKSEYERFTFGEGLDLNPFVLKTKEESLAGAILTWNF